jgi:hypothetical protein
MLSIAAVAAALLFGAEAAPVDGLKLQSFGTGRSQIKVKRATEFELLSYTLSSSGKRGGSVQQGDPVGRGTYRGLWRRR